MVRSDVTDMGLSVGGGVSVPLGSRWSVRPDARVLVGAGAIVSRVEAGVGVAYGW